MDIQIYKEAKVEEKHKERVEEETKLEAKNESYEEVKVEEKTESFELNKKNLPRFKRLIHQAEKWIKKEKLRVAGLKKEHMENKAIWRPRKQVWEESLKKVQADLNGARITQEKLLAKAYSILVEQGRISQRLSNTT